MLSQTPWRGRNHTDAERHLTKGQPPPTVAEMARIEHLPQKKGIGPIMYYAPMKRAMDVEVVRAIGGIIKPPGHGT